MGTKIVVNGNTIVQKVVVGTPIRTVQASQFVSASNITNFSVDSIAHGDLLVYDSASGKYTATSITAGDGITVTYTPGAYGDVLISGTSNATQGTYGSTARVPVISIDSNGLIDSIGSVLVSVAGGSAITAIDFDSSTSTLTVTTGDDPALTYSTVITLDPFSTDDLSEGSTNKYYTKARVDSDINALVDSAYIQARQADIFRDSSFITNIVTSEYIQARQADIYRDSGFVTNIVDSAYIQARQADIYRDSAFVTGIVTAEYIQANQNNYLDSTLAVQLIDTAHVQARQITYNTSDFLDSTTVALVVDEAYVQARQTTYDFLDSAEVIALVDSAYVQARQADVDLSSYATQTYVTNRVDSAINALIDAAPGALNTLNELAAALNNDDSFATTVTTSIATKLSSADFDTRFDSALGTKTTDDVTEGSNLYFTNTRAQDAITVTDAGGGGSLAYAGGTITYTGPSASEVRAHFTAGPSIDITDGVVKVDSASIIKVAGIETNKVHTTDSGLRVYGNILPSADSTYSLGDSNHKWKALYVSGRTITLGTINLRDDGGSFTVSNVSGGDPAALNLSANTTDDLSEGSTNKYYTSTRVDSDITALVDAAYIQARQADIFRDSAFITNIVDSAYVATKVAANVTTRYLQLDSNLPGDTTNKLYSQNGHLYWNGASLDSAGVGYIPMNKAGDTMTGDLIINKTTPQIKLNDDDDAGVEIAIGLDGEDFYIYEPEDPGGTQVPYATFGVGKQWLRIEDISEDAYLFGRRIWTSGNDGSGTGLDADLLDGQEGSYYLNYNNLTNAPNVLDSADIAALLGSLNEAAISSVVDSAYVQARQVTYSNVSEFTNDANYLDSTTIQGVVNSAYVQARQITYSTADFLDSYYATTLIDSAYINARVDAIDASGVDSAATILLIQETVDSAYVAARVGDLGIDSASTIALITETVDSAYINARVNANVDSAQVQLIIDSNFQNLSQNILPDLDDTRDLGSGSKRFRRIYAGSRIFLGTNLSLRDSSDTLVLSGGSWGINDQIDSYVDTAYVRAKQDYAYSSLTGAPTNVSEFTNDANYLDSITIQGVVNQTFVRNLQITYNTSDFTDSAFVTGLPVSTFANDANYLDSTTVLPLFSASGGITYDNAGGFKLDSTADVRFNSIRLYNALNVDGNTRISGNITAEADLIVDGNFYVNGIQTTISTQSLSVGDNLIHLADSNELSDTLDIGFVGHYYGDGQRRHTGFFRDASNSQYYLFNNYVDSDLDSSISAGEINRGDASFQLATLNVGTLVGNVTGNADTATVLQTSRKIGVQGHISADSNLFNGGGDFTITNVVINNGVIVNDMINASAAIADTKLATISTAGKVSNSATTATNTNTASAIVARDASGNFSAGTITGTKGLFDGNTTSALDAYAANNGFGARIIRDINDAYSPAALLVAGDGDGTADILFEVRSSTNGTSVDVTNTHKSIDTRFAILGGGHTIIAPTSRTDGIDSAGTVVRNSSLLSVYGNATVDRLYVAAESSGGIAFPDNAFGGGGDTARIYLTSDGSENTRLTIETTDNAGDEIHLKTPSDNGVKINNYIVIHEENIGSFIDSTYINSLTAANIDSAALITVVDSTYVQLRQDYAYSSLTGSPTNVSFFTNDANYLDSTTATNLVSALPVSTFANDANYLDSTTVQDVIDATYIQANQITYNTSDFLDSTTVELVVNSTYIQARQDYAYSSLTGAPTNVSFFTNDANYLDSTTVQDVIDATYIQANQTNFLDSVYAAALIDSAYVNARINVGAGIQHFVYTATDGQTTFSGNDYYGNALSYVNNKEQVYRNGVLLVRGDQYTATSGNSVVILNGCDSDDVISISAFSNTRFLDNVSDSGDGITVTGNLSVQGDLNFTGSIAIRGLQEPIVQKSGSINVVNYSFDSGAIFYETAPDSDWTANFTDIPTTLRRATVMTIITEQGADSAFLPLNVQIEGVAQTIRWEGSSAPVPSTNATDQTSFTLLRVDSSGTDVWKVLGQNVSYA